MIAPKHLLWRFPRVTVCIAALCESEKQIVMASDSRVGFGDFSADRGAVKYSLLPNDYLLLIAGNDVVYAGETVKRISQRVGGSILRGTDSLKNPDEVALIAHEELVETRRRLIEAKILSRYGINSSEFAKRGKRLFTDQVFYEICNKIANQDLSLCFLLAGFDYSGRGHLRVIQADDSPHDYDALGFAAIGSGASAAMAALSFAKDHSILSSVGTLWSMSCHVLGAKFMAESADQVGKDTFLLSIGSKGRFEPHPFCGIEPIRKAWEKTGAPRLSKEAVGVLKDVLYESSEGPTAAMSGESIRRCLYHMTPAMRESLKDYPSMARENGDPTQEDIIQLLNSETIRDLL